jgi:hypothetical protein
MESVIMAVRKSDRDPNWNGGIGHSGVRNCHQAAKQADKPPTCAPAWRARASCCRPALRSAKLTGPGLADQPPSLSTSRNSGW